MTASVDLYWVALHLTAHLSLGPTTARTRRGLVFALRDGGGVRACVARLAFGAFGALGATVLEVLLLALAQLLVTTTTTTTTKKGWVEGAGTGRQSRVRERQLWTKEQEKY
jgi:hypothetical protein